jgi:hypothetical protein
MHDLPDYPGPGRSPDHSRKTRAPAGFPNAVQIFTGPALALDARRAPKSISQDENDFILT